jgi:hypothetical protein
LQIMYIIFIFVFKINFEINQVMTEDSQLPISVALKVAMIVTLILNV